MHSFLNDLFVGNLWVNQKEFRTNGRPGLSKIFQKFKEGESVAVVREPSIRFKVSF